MRPRLIGRVRHALLAWIVLATGVALSVAAAYLASRQVEREARLKFESAVADAQDAIEARIRAYSDVLRGARGLFSTSNAVSREAFRSYIESLDLSRFYPGIQVIHYSKRVSAAERPAFEAMVRNDTSVEPRGYPGFRINPPGERPEYAIVQYVEPMAGNEVALGLDLGGDPVRLAALERTRDSGRLTASGTIALAHDPSRHPGFAMRLPVYRKGMPVDTAAQRRAAFEGMVSASFIALDLMRGVLSEPFLQKIHVRIHDAGFLDDPRGLESPAAGNRMFDSDRLLAAPSPRESASSGAVAGLHRTSALEVGGRRWNLYFSARPGFFGASDRWLPWTALFGGGIISLLLFGLIRSLATTGERAAALAARITEDLRRSETRLAGAQRMTQELIEALPNPIFFKGTDGRYLGVNKAWEAYFGTPREAFLGKTVHDLYPSDPQAAERLHAMDQVLWERPGTQVCETTITTPDGARHDTIYYKATFAGADDRVAGLIGTIVDITERKQAERALRESESKYRSVIAAIAEGVLLRDRNGRIVTCNAGAERILGRTLEQMKGNVYFDSSWEAIREDGSRFPDAERPLNAALRSGRLQSNVVMGLRKQDGSVLWLSMNAQPLFEEADARPSGVVTTITDITHRKQAQLRQAMEHRVTRLLSECETLEQAAPQIIQTICATLGFACGARWVLERDGDRALLAETWSVASAEIMEFVALGRRARPSRRATGGLIGRAWASGEPVWITDVTEDASFRRGPLAARAGLRGALAFPICFGSDVLGVMEFFSRASRAPEEVLVQSTRSIGSQIGQFMARRQAEERVRHLAHFDELTGLPNRTLFNQRLGHALAQARRHERALAVLFIDLDRFKNINDTLGHEAGDGVLREVADRLRECLREGDTVGRLGGDEFVVLIEELPQPVHVATVAQKILAAAAKPFLLAGREFHISASIGISAYPGDGEDLQNLFKNADIAMYRAKEQGKNTYQFYSAQMNVHSLERLTLESDLRHAVERDEFVLHYQPKVDIGSGRVTGMEALVRWQHPDKGLLAPAQFIRLAEETGLIVPLGDRVLKTACARNRDWHEQGLPGLRIAVNLSPRQFARENLVQDVAAVLGETGLNPTALEFDVTERMVMQDPKRAAKLLKKLKAIGIHLSIDEFGTGHSSLNYLKRFPVDNVKIDHSFIKDLPGNGDDAAITRAIIALAHILRLRVIAEGVETGEQLAFLRACGCDEMQGYLFSRPLPEDELLRLLQNCSPAVRSAA